MRMMKLLESRSNKGMMDLFSILQLQHKVLAEQFESVIRVIIIESKVFIAARKKTLRNVESTEASPEKLLSSDKFTI